MGFKFPKKSGEIIMAKYPTNQVRTCISIPGICSARAKDRAVVANMRIGNSIMTG
jgi:hypothetical protein